MKRRDFLTGAGTTAYSVVVFAEGLGAAPAPSDRFERIAPPAARSGGMAGEPHMTLVDLDTDVLVAGGGMAGVCAALAAARHGARVILAQDRSRLGGNSSSEVKMHVVGANMHKGRPGWREGGIIEELRLDDAARNPQRCFELWDLLLYDKVASEPGILLLLDSTLYAATVRGGRITEAMVRCDRTEHLYRVKARLYIDSTGDSRLGLEAGAEMRYGREARAEFGESLAPETEDRRTQGSSILFTARLHDKPMPFRPPSWARKVTKEHLKMRPVTSWEYGYWWIEWGGNLSTIRDDARIRHELLSIVMGVWDYIKNSGDHPTSANWALDWVGMMPGKRESRRLVGDHILTQHDLLRGEFEDAVAIGGWAMDDHPPGGFDRADLPPFTPVRTPEIYNIPLRSLYSRNVANLMMAGRNVSASHVAFSSTRVMATCSVEGQAAGTAAALCVRHGVTPRELYQRKDLLKTLQQALLRDDQTIRGLRNEDPLDLARQASVTASSESQAAPASNILDGWVRDLPGGAAHHWAGRLDGGSAWIELSWDRPRRISEVQITFDTGFQRELTLSASAAANQGVIRAPQPETVRDYTVRCRRQGGEGWTELASVRDNHQRLRRHRFDAVEAQSVRIEITATNGIPEARVFEVRCYA